MEKRRAVGVSLVFSCLVNVLVIIFLVDFVGVVGSCLFMVGLLFCGFFMGLDFFGIFLIFFFKVKILKVKFFELILVVLKHKAKSEKFKDIGCNSTI